MRINNSLNCSKLKQLLGQLKSLKQELEQEFVVAVKNKDKEAMKRVSEMKKGDKRNSRIVK